MGLLRTTAWRQGDLIANTQQIASELGLDCNYDGSIVVITHDCDLTHDAEDSVEVIAGSRVESVKPDFENAKNPRTIHIRYKTVEGDVRCLELRHTNRHRIKVTAFQTLAIRDERFDLSNEELRGLKRWLAARYARPAFPNAFEDRLRRSVSTRKDVKKRIEEILSPNSTYLLGLWFDLGEERNTELDSSCPYNLSISVVYDAENGGSSARDRAEEVATNLKTLFENAYGTPDRATEIALERCEAVADTHISLADIRKVDQWRLEYVSLRETPTGEFVPPEGF